MFASDKVNAVRQADSSAHTVALLEEQNKVNNYLAARLYDLCTLQAETNHLLQQLLAKG